jgi:hypothetical protein
MLFDFGLNTVCRKWWEFRGIIMLMEFVCDDFAGIQNWSGNEE